MHIPDSFLSTPVWVTLDAVSLPAFALLARRATRTAGESRAPLLGVLGAFVFAAQMINFPVGIGTSGHLLGGALLVCTVGPAAASVVMTAIIAVQAFVFQDGGVLALGANVFNMAIAGVLAAYLPFRLWGWRRRNGAVFAAGCLSVMVSAALALTELLLSGVPMPRPVLLVSVGLFGVSALIEGAITVLVIQAVERINPGWIQNPERPRRKTVLSLAAAAVVLASAGFLIASADPDGIQRLGSAFGAAAKMDFHAPLADYQMPVFGAVWIRRVAAGLAGISIVYLCCALLTKLFAKLRSV